jgi:restriction system protein
MEITIGLLIIGAYFVIGIAGLFVVISQANKPSSITTQTSRQLKWPPPGPRSPIIQTPQDIPLIDSVDWRQFEIEVAGAFIRLGYRVTLKGGDDADEGIDMIIHYADSFDIVQCKHWHRRQVGVKIVREMYGVMMHHGARRIAIVTSGYFTQDAWAFAKGKPIELIHRKRLLGLLAKSVSPQRTIRNDYRTAKAAEHAAHADIHGRRPRLDAGAESLLATSVPDTSLPSREASS